MVEEIEQKSDKQASSSKLKKILTFFVVVIIIFAVAGVLLSSPTPEEDGKIPPKESVSLIYKNYPVTTKDMDNNEPHLAINPQNHLNIVAGSNDYNTPRQDAWPGYYTTFDGGKTWTEELIPGYPGDSEIGKDPA